MLTGVKVVVQKNVHADVKRAVCKFVAWLRRHSDFPVRLTIYLFAEERVTAPSGNTGYSFLWKPDDRTNPAVIHAATGDYDELLKTRGNMDDALCAVLYSIILHIVQYQDWCFEKSWSKATIKRHQNALLNKYASDVKDII